MEYKLEYRRINNAFLNSLEIGKEVCLVLDELGMKTARQIVYDRQFKYPGCRIDTSRSMHISNMDGMCLLFMRRLSFGTSTQGKPEPSSAKSKGNGGTKCDKKSNKNPQTL